MIDGIDEDQIRRYVERHDGATVPQVLGRFELPPSAAAEVREVIESPDSAEVDRWYPGKNLLCNVVAPPFEGGEGYPSPPSEGVGVTLHRVDATTGGDLS